MVKQEHSSYVSTIILLPNFQVQIVVLLPSYVTSLRFQWKVFPGLEMIPMSWMMLLVFKGGLQGIGFESNSSWFKWVCKSTGSLTFAITPTKVDDDIDFVLYELTNGIDDCQTKNPIRCEAAGEDVALYPSACHGPTGLRDESKDTSSLQAVIVDKTTGFLR